MKIKIPQSIKEIIEEDTINGYKWVTRRGQVLLVHRLIWEEHYGKIPSGMDIHHKDGNKLNNKIENLECLTREEHKARHKKQ